MENNEDFLKQADINPLKKVCPNCSQKNILQRITRTNDVFVYKYYIICIECLKCYLKEHNTHLVERIFFKSSHECKYSDIEKFKNKN